MNATQRKSCPACFDHYADHFVFCPKDGAQLQKHLSSNPPPRDGRICPTCRRTYGAEAEFCPRDSEQLLPYGLFAAQVMARESAAVQTPALCPRCGMRGAPGQVFCALDGERLVALQ